MKELLGFFKDKAIQKHIMFAFGGLIVFLFIVFLSLDVYTRHGSEFSVPDFRGLNIDEAGNLADEKNLILQVNDSVFNADQKPGAVVSQSPSANSKVKPNRVIYVTINAKNSEKVEMPNVVGKSFRQAEADLITIGLRIGTKHYAPYPAKDYVLHQYYNRREVAPGKKVIKGAAIDLVLGNGNAAVAVDDSI
jgi:eukaryotic-like serine/threonine-protein kinase